MGKVVRKIEGFEDIINSIPLILQYIIPGYLAIAVFGFALSKKIDTKNILFFSCVISYALLSFVSLLRIKWLQQIPDTAVMNSALSIIIGFIFVCFVAILSQRRWFRKITVKLFHKTLNNDIWRDILDLENGSNLKVYLKEQEYYIIGHHKNHEENGNDSWLALSAFAKFDKMTNELYKNEASYLDRKDIIITVRFSDIEHIEIF